MESALFWIVTLILLGALLATCVYLILVLNEARHALKRINKILDRIEATSSFLEDNLLNNQNRFMNVFAVLKEGLSFVAEIKKTLREEKKRHES